MTADQPTYHGEESAYGPDEEGHVDAAGRGQHARRGHEDPAPDYTACTNIRMKSSYLMPRVYWQARNNIAAL